MKWAITFWTGLSRGTQTTCVLSRATVYHSEYFDWQIHNYVLLYQEIVSANVWDSKIKQVNFGKKTTFLFQVH